MSRAIDARAELFQSCSWAWASTAGGLALSLEVAQSRWAVLVSALAGSLGVGNSNLHSVFLRRFTGMGGGAEQVRGGSVLARQAAVDGQSQSIVRLPNTSDGGAATPITGTAVGPKLGGAMSPNGSTSAGGYVPSHVELVPKSAPVVLPPSSVIAVVGGGTSVFRVASIEWWELPNDISQDDREEFVVWVQKMRAVRQ